jgi:hypothetical protein
MLTERLKMAYTPMNYNAVALIRQDSTYKNMSSDDVLERIMNHKRLQVRRLWKFLEIPS